MGFIDHDAQFGRILTGPIFGGLSAENYRTISGATSATATRDLAALVERGALRRTGQLKGTRYWLTLT
jgi:Fic family protein